ncbi:MAG: hypothetical protein II255_01680 [Ruminiclostridium sp.]|nr:hypothetical protein [Ruminiclostridium sp.]
MAVREKGTRISRSLQTRMALGYAVIIVALLVLLNTYPLLMSQNLMFRSQQTALQNQAVLVTNSLTTADQLTPEGVEAAIAPLEDLEVERILVTDEAGLVLYDTAEDSIAGKFALTVEVVAALEGKDHFISEYEDGIFSSRASAPVLNRNTVIGAVCLYEWDSSQGMLLEELQQNLHILSLVVIGAVLGLFLIFSRVFTRRVSLLLAGITKHLSYKR